MRRLKRHILSGLSGLLIAGTAQATELTTAPLDPYVTSHEVGLRCTIASVVNREVEVRIEFRHFAGHIDKAETVVLPPYGGASLYNTGSCPCFCRFVYRGSKHWLRGAMVFGGNHGDPVWFYPYAAVPAR